MIGLSKLEDIQQRALAGEPRGHLVALVEFAWGLPMEQAERLIPRAGAIRMDCANPIRDENGMFLGCEPGEGSGSGSGADKPSRVTVTVTPPPRPRAYIEERESEKAQEQLPFSNERWEKRDQLGSRSNKQPGDFIAGKRDETIRPGMSVSSAVFAEVRDEYVNELTDEEFAAGLFYSYKGDGVINTALRSGSIDGEHNYVAQEYVKRLDSAIAKYTMEDDVYAARGMAGEFAEKFASSLSEGDVYQDPGYTSTSATAPLDFIKIDGKETPVSVSVRVKIPRGFNAAPIPSKFPEEDELLLPRNSKFRVTKIAKDGDKTQIEVELVR